MDHTNFVAEAPSESTRPYSECLSDAWADQSQQLLLEKTQVVARSRQREGELRRLLDDRERRLHDLHREKGL